MSDGKVSDGKVSVDRDGRLRVRDAAGRIRVLAPEGLRPIDDVAAATAASLRSPSDFIPLEEAVIEGDHVAIAAECAVPRLAEIIGAVLDFLPRQKLGGLTIVLPEACPAVVQSAVCEVAANVAEVVVHDPDAQESLAYLAADEEGEPVYLNRALVDADFVLPIVLGHPAGGLRPSFTLGGVYPAFSGRASIRRDLQQRILETGDDARRAADHLAEESAWLLGLMVVLVVIPGEAGQIAAIHVGTATGLQRDARPQLEAGWRRSSHIQSSLVCVSFQATDPPATCSALADGLHAALNLCEPGGALVLVLQDLELEGLSFDLLAADLSYDETLQKLAEVATDEARFCALLAIAREQCRIYLYGSTATVDRLESMGIFPVTAGELERLIQQCPHPIVMNDGQYCVTGPEGD